MMEEEVMGFKNQWIYTEGQHPALNTITRYRFKPSQVNLFGFVTGYEWSDGDAPEVWETGHNFETMHHLTKHFDSLCNCEGPNEATNFVGEICPLCEEVKHHHTNAALTPLEA